MKSIRIDISFGRPYQLLEFRYLGPDKAYRDIYAWAWRRLDVSFFFVTITVATWRGEPRSAGKVW